MFTPLDTRVGTGSVVSLLLEDILPTSPLQQGLIVASIFFKVWYMTSIFKSPFILAEILRLQCL